MDYSNTVEKSRPRSLPRVMSVVVALQWPGSEFMSIVPVTTKGSVVAQHLVGHLRTYCCLRAMLPPRPGCQASEGHAWVHGPTRAGVHANILGLC